MLRLSLIDELLPRFQPLDAPIEVSNQGPLFFHFQNPGLVAINRRKQMRNWEFVLANRHEFTSPGPQAMGGGTRKGFGGCMQNVLSGVEDR